MKEILFIVTEDEDGGFTARSVGQNIFTEGDSREELLRNIRDAVGVHFDSPEEIPRVLHLHYVHDEVVAL
jgi:predicted RNase H-like HicB family nuclease